MRSEKLLVFKVFFVLCNNSRISWSGTSELTASVHQKLHCRNFVLLLNSSDINYFLLLLGINYSPELWWKDNLILYYVDVKHFWYSLTLHLLEYFFLPSSIHIVGSSTKASRMFAFWISVFKTTVFYIFLPNVFLICSLKNFTSRVKQWFALFLTMASYLSINVISPTVFAHTKQEYFWF